MGASRTPQREVAVAVLLSWVNRGLGVLSTLVLIPILFQRISAEELGLWFLIAGSQPLLGQLSYGLLTVLSRHVAMAKGEGDAGTADRQFDLATVYGTGRLVFRGAAGLTAVFGSVLGVITLPLLNLESTPWEQAAAAWGVYLFGYCLGVWTAPSAALLTGGGRVASSTTVDTVASVVNLVAGVAVAVAGGGLIGLAVVSLGIVVVKRVLIAVAARRGEGVPTDRRFDRAYAGRLFRTAGLSWLNVFGVFVVMQTSAYFVVGLSTVAELPKYTAAFSLAQIPYQLAISAAGAGVVFVSRAWRAGDHTAARRMTLRTAAFGMTVVAAGHGVALVAGEEFLRLWIGPDRFIGYPVLLTLCLLFSLECGQFVMSSAGRATDDESYAGPVLVAAVLSPVFILSLSGWLGLLAVPLGMLLAQTLTVNWYTVYRTVTRMGIGWGAYLRQVVVPWVVVFGGVLGIGGLAAWALRSQVPAGRTQDAAILAVAVATAGLVAGVIYRLPFRRLWPFARRTPSTTPIPAQEP